MELKNSKVLVILRGVAGCGKSTWLLDNDLEHYSLSSDKIRLMFSSPKLLDDGSVTIPQENDKRVWELLYTLLKFRMGQGIFTIIDATHTKRCSLKEYKKLCNHYNYQMVIVDFSSIPKKTILQRNANREDYKRVPVEVIERMYSNIQEDISDEYTVVPYDSAISYLYSLETPINVDNYEKVVAFGDIHSCYEPIKEYFDKNPYSENNLYVFCGDYFDRGIQTREVLSFLLKMVEKPNIVLLKGNHEIWLKNYVMSGLDAYLTNSFKKTLEDMGSGKDELYKIYKQLRYMFYIEFGGRTIIFTHGGIPKVPSIVYGHQCVKGVGAYEKCDYVDEQFMKNTVDYCYSVHGHRNINNAPIQNNRTFNLEGKVEFGGYLRIVEFTKTDITTIEIKNNVFDQKDETKGSL